jgi:hypothetical protein
MVQSDSIDAARFCYGCAEADAECECEGLVGVCAAYASSHKDTGASLELSMYRLCILV